MKDAFVLFKNTAKLLFNSKIKNFQSDQGGEFKVLNTLFHTLGIQFRYSCPHTHQQNGLAERKHMHIVETGLTLLSQAKMPLSFWWEAKMHMHIVETPLHSTIFITTL